MIPLQIDHCPGCGMVLRQRSLEQNDKFHALLQDIADQKDWAGQKLDVETWKRLMVAAWERASGRSVRIFPSLDGAGVDMVYQRTSRMNKAELSELIEYATAWAVENDVQLRAEADIR